MNDQSKNERLVAKMLADCARQTLNDVEGGNPNVRIMPERFWQVTALAEGMMATPSSALSRWNG